MNTTTKYTMLSVLALTVLLPAIGLVNADNWWGPQTINDDRLLSHLYGLTQNGTFISDGDGVTHEFATTRDNNGWYSTTITTTVGVESEEVSFRFMHDSTENVYLLQADDPAIDVRIAIPTANTYWQNPPDTIPKNVHDSDSSDPYNLYDQETQWCVVWTDSWTVESDVSNYFGKVLIEWDGEDYFLYYCLFPYNLSETTISYEGQTIENIASGSDHLNVGSPTYNLSGNWIYTSAS